MFSVKFKRVNLTIQHVVRLAGRAFVRGEKTSAASPTATDMVSTSFRR